MTILYTIEGAPMFTGYARANGNAYAVTNGVVDVTDEADVPAILQSGFSYSPQTAHLTNPTAAAIADAVLDEALSGHTDAGSLGKALADVETDVTAVLADTDELQGDIEDGGRVDLLVDAIKAKTDTIT